MSTTALMTVEQFEQSLARDGDGHKHELLEGEHLVSPFPKAGHGRLQHRLLYAMNQHLPQGCEAFIEAGYQLSGNILLRADVSLAAPEQAGETPAEGWFQGSPLIAVEIVSPSNSASEINRLTGTYLRYGAREVWVVYPDERQVHVHEPGGIAHRYEDRIVSAVLPSLTLELAELFRGLV